MTIAATIQGQIRPRSLLLWGPARNGSIPGWRICSPAVLGIDRSFGEWNPTSTRRLRLAVPFVGLGVVLAVGYGFYRLVHLIVSSLFELLPALDPTVVAALIATMTTAIVSVLSIVYNQRKTKEREIAESHRQQKIDLYKKFMDNVVVGALRLAKDKADDADLQKHLETFFLDFTANLIVWGSPGVIHEYTKSRKSGNQPQMLLQIDDVLRAIREDLGHSNRRIGRGDLIALFLTDPERLKELTQVDR